MVITVRPIVEPETRRVGLEYSINGRVLWCEFLGYEDTVSDKKHLEVLQRAVTEGIKLQIEQSVAAEIMIAGLE